MSLTSATSAVQPVLEHLVASPETLPEIEHFGGTVAVDLVARMEIRPDRLRRC
jgi:hypothetical protein